jgi:sugar/nucleoside kinase (ribokinase family)
VSILMTRSSDGATVVRQGEVTEYPASPCQFIDATAAGDYYLAGYLHGFLDACSLAQTMSLGSHMASQVCAVRGSRCRVAIDV